VGPLALFELPEEEDVKQREWLRPLAVQYDRIDPKGEKPKPPMITPKVCLKAIN
jgi:hypothetical protein